MFLPGGGDFYNFFDRCITSVLRLSIRLVSVHSEGTPVLRGMGVLAWKVELDSF